MIMIGARRGEGRVDARGGGGGERARIKKFYVVGDEFPLWGYFFMWAVFSLHVGVIFPCVRGGVSFLHGGSGGGGELLGLPPITIFARAFCCHIFYCTDFIIFPDRGGLNFLRELFDPPKKLPPSPPPPAPTKINNFCPPLSHGQHFRFSHYYHYPITHTPGPACSLRNNINVLKSRPPSLNAPPPPPKKRKK